MSRQSQASLSRKTQVVLGVIFAVLLLIALRAWDLSVLEHEEKLEEARRPQRRVVLEAAKRGTIRDRFNLPLATNKVHYQASVIYSQILQIPQVRSKRRIYIRNLAETLGRELNLDPDRLEDLIHSKAALYHQVPFLIKDNLTEKEYYRLKFLEKEWIGLSATRLPRRHYPQGRIAADIIGYMGAINRTEYESVLTEMRALEEYVLLREQGEDPPLPEDFSMPEEAYQRLLNLQEKAYTIHDSVGKMGIEGRYEQTLRGFQGTREYTTDARGNFTRELPGSREPLSGQRILLSISAELQTFAEELLIANEQIRQARLTTMGSLDRSTISPKQPWIKGGAIVAMDPSTGEILALASHPRYDPNDFVTQGKSRKNVTRWFETEDYLADIWEQRRPLEREIYDPLTGGIHEQELLLNWDAYLDFVLPLEGPLRQSIELISTLNDAINVQQNESERYVRALETEYDKTLVSDLCRLAVWDEAFDDELLEACGHFTLFNHREHCCAMAQLKGQLKEKCKEIFHKNTFIDWRKEHEKEFLKLKRAEEKAKKRYPRPYIDLLDNEERRQFEEFWRENSQDLIAALLIGEWGAVEETPITKHHLEYFRNLRENLTDDDPSYPHFQTLQFPIQQLPSHLAYSYLATLRSFNDLSRPLLGSYRQLRRDNGKQLEKHLAMGFYPKYGFGYGRSHAYRQATTQGSIFKLVTAYAGLIQTYQKHPTGDLNPLYVHDAWEKRGSHTIVGYSDAGQPIPQLYKGGRLPKSLSRNIGYIDVLQAIVHSSNIYFSLLAGDILDSPEELAETARLFSYGSPTGIELPGEIGGHIPSDLSTNRTGLYAMAIGQHTLVVTPLQAAVMLSAIANGGKVLQPKIVKILAGKLPLRISTPSLIEEQPTIVRHEAFMPQKVREILFEGMRQVALRSQKASIKALRKLYRKYPEAIFAYETLGDTLIGKTSTAESVELLDLEVPPQNRNFNHLWFGGILTNPQEESFMFKDRFGKPELVVIVYLRYGGYGKDTAPVAAQVAQKWRQISNKY